MIGPTFVRDCFDTQFDWQLINPFDYLSTTGPFVIGLRSYSLEPQLMGVAGLQTTGLNGVGVSGKGSGFGYRQESGLSFAIV